MNPTFIRTFRPEDWPTRNGVFDYDPTQTLYLWIDMKDEGETMLSLVQRAIQPLVDADYVTTVRRTSNGEEIVRPGPITVIGTGNTPLAAIEAANPRTMFYDAPLVELGTSFANLTSAVSPFASAKFSAVFGDVRDSTLNETQMATLRSQIADAKERGMGVRYWDTPSWPISVRNSIWGLLWREGVSLINVDDLEGAKTFMDSHG